MGSRQRFVWECFQFPAASAIHKLKTSEHQGFIPTERRLLCELVKDLAQFFGPDDTNSYSASKPCLVTQTLFIICWYQFFWDSFFLKGFLLCLTRSIFMRRFPSLQYVLLFWQSQVWNNKSSGGLDPVPACSLWGEKQVWTLPQEINQRCRCPPECKLLMFSPEYSAVLFYTAVNDLDMVPVESPYYFVMENRNSAVEIYSEWTGT